MVLTNMGTGLCSTNIIYLFKFSPESVFLLIVSDLASTFQSQLMYEFMSEK